ncbi:MAG TPA: hypothetical protein VJR05_04950 [Acidimicrobiia bacterium]|nr:hypothetical protein [Acidimicrobiia bacterium]
MKSVTLLLAVVVLAACTEAEPAEVTAEMQTIGEAESLTRFWIALVLEGELDHARLLTHGVAGEPDALQAVAELILSYHRRYGAPVVEVFPHNSSGELTHMCVRWRFPGFVMDGGLVLRRWPDIGMRLWEFRGGMEGCIGNALTTTTLPPP